MGTKGQNPVSVCVTFELTSNKSTLKSRDTLTHLTHRDAHVKNAIFTTRPGRGTATQSRETITREGGLLGNKAEVSFLLMTCELEEGTQSALCACRRTMETWGKGISFMLPERREKSLDQDTVTGQTAVLPSHRLQCGWNLIIPGFLQITCYTWCLAKFRMLHQRNNY